MIKEFRDMFHENTKKYHYLTFKDNRTNKPLKYNNSLNIF